MFYKQLVFRRVASIIIAIDLHDNVGVSQLQMIR